MSLTQLDHHAVDTLTHNGYTITIDHDPDPANPRQEYDNLATLVLFHRRYTLGDQDHEYNPDDYTSWTELKAAIESDGAHAITPVYLYDHSGLAINTTGFNCPWDSGQLGWAFINSHTLAKSGLYPDQADAIVKAEIDEYGHYLSGNVYSYTITDHNGDITGSCHGFYDITHAREAALHEVTEESN